MSEALEVAASLDMMVVAVNPEAAFEHGVLAIAMDCYSRPASMSPALVSGTAHKGIPLEYFVLAPLNWLDGADLAFGIEVGDSEALVEEVMVGLELEADLFLAAMKSKCEIEVGVCVDAM